LDPSTRRKHRRCVVIPAQAIGLGWEAASFLGAAGPIYAFQHVAIVGLCVCALVLLFAEPGTVRPILDSSLLRALNS
jgi:hypothetical protein